MFLLPYPLCRAYEGTSQHSIDLTRPLLVQTRPVNPTTFWCLSVVPTRPSTLLFMILRLVQLLMLALVSSLSARIHHATRLLQSYSAHR
ncbi:hypothetical protein M405DRAFT_809741 [Rhizopogon salebrosus TDB-379]|nr:hypothetical protein M405DRAFT_809741 [Rhizopogon salebrosus TDB-379]